MAILSFLRRSRKSSDRPPVQPVAQRPLMSSRTKYVYLMINHFGLHKIGVANDVDDRRGEIERMSGVPVLVVCFAPYADAYEAEALLHRHFRSSRTVGEWFQFSADQVREATRLISGGL